MSKGNRIKKQRKARTELLSQKGTITPIELKNTKDHHSYWICGYYWNHDVILVEPFCAVKRFHTWEITNLSANEFEFHQACQLLEGNGTMLIFEDRVMALDACEAIENQNTLLESFASYMDEYQLLEYLNGKEMK